MNAASAQRSTLLEEARAAVERGWSIVPCGPDKRPLVSWKEAQQTAATVEQVEQWAGRYAPASWAVVTGSTSGLVVLDFDGDDGRELQDIFAAELPVNVRTGSGGMHVYVEHPGTFVKTVNGKSAYALGTQFPGLDVRGDGGYAIFAGRNCAGPYELVRTHLVAVRNIPREFRPLLGLPERERPTSDYLLTTYLTRATVGNRNDTGFALSAQLRDNGYDRTTAEAVMVEYARTVPQGDDPYTAADAIRTVNSAYSRAARDPWGSTPALTNPSADAVEAAHTPPSKTTPAADEPAKNTRRSGDDEPLHTDVGNARRLVAMHGHDLRHVAGLGWLAWDGTRWRTDDDGEVERRAVNVTDAILAEANARRSDDNGRADELWKHGRRSQGAARIEAMVKLARSQREVIAPISDLDANTYLLNVANGTIDLRTGEMRPHNRHDLITRRVDIAYDGQATCPVFARYLAEVFGGDADLIAYVQRVVGYTLTGDTSERALFVLHGDGSNGKTTLLETIAGLLGDFAATADASSFTTAASGRARFDLARFRGKRLVRASEMERDATLAEALIKQITGGESIDAQFKYRDHFEYTPQFKLWLAVNDLPAVVGDNHAIWVRLKIVPFNVQINRPDTKLREKLRDELPGILAWAIRGALDWQCDGLGSCRAVRQATDAYRGEQDRVAAFLARRCIRRDDERVANPELYANYAAWEHERGEEPLREPEFFRRLKRNGLTAGKSGSTRFHRGIVLVANDGESA